MTCFWDGIMTYIKPKKNIPAFISYLKKKNTTSVDVMWNGESLKKYKKLRKENFNYIKNFDSSSIGNGHLTSSCDPFLILIAYIFNVNIEFRVKGVLTTFKVRNPRKTLRFRCDNGHFWAG